jgi:phage baseplate assembly protein W
MSIYKDFRLEFDIHPIRKDLIMIEDEYSVIQSIRNLILMNHYEAPFSPERGCNIRKQLFEPLSQFSASDIGRWIEETITNFEPRAKLSKVNVAPNSEQDGYIIDIEIFIDTSTEAISLNFLLERLR